MFEKASRLKLRFDTDRGPMATEDLWDLPLTSATGKTNLDNIAVGLHISLSTSNLSFVNTPAVADEGNQLKLAIVKHIIDVRLAENAARATERDNAAKKQSLLALIAKKEDAALEGHSLEDLRKMAESL
jgi:hypothetical protein